ncbi:hypothetical protein O9929_05590 [Vibrio lentus]|nr:hypothetical protein [Vibrio lentus]
MFQSKNSMPKNSLFAYGFKLALQLQKKTLTMFMRISPNTPPQHVIVAAKFSILPVRLLPMVIDVHGI